MINGRIWTVVSPNVGVPVFFVALALTSVFIHLHVILNTSWYYEYVQGAAAAAEAAASGGG